MNVISIILNILCSLVNNLFLIQIKTYSVGFMSVTNFNKKFKFPHKSKVIRIKVQLHNRKILAMLEKKVLKFLVLFILVKYY